MAKRKPKPKLPPAPSVFDCQVYSVGDETATPAAFAKACKVSKVKLHPYDKLDKREYEKIVPTQVYRRDDNDELMPYKNDPTKFKMKWKMAGAPCRELKNRCPVQLYFDKGKATLRLCTPENLKQESHSIAVGSPQEALRVGNAVCAEWQANGKQFPASVTDGLPLGRAKKTRRKK